MSHDEIKMAIETPSCRMTRSKWPLRRCPLQSGGESKPSMGKGKRVGEGYGLG